MSADGTLPMGVRHDDVSDPRPRPWLDDDLVDYGPEPERLACRQCGKPWDEPRLSRTACARCARRILTNIDNVKRKQQCPTCRQDLNEPARESKVGVDCAQCGQGLSEQTVVRILKRARRGRVAAALARR